MSFPTQAEIQAATPEQASALVHQHLFGFTQTGTRWKDAQGRVVKAPHYHDTEAAMVELLDRLRLTLGKSSPDDPLHNPSKPWFAGKLGKFFIVAATPGAAVCKAALISQLEQPKDDEVAEADEEEQQP